TSVAVWAAAMAGGTWLAFQGRLPGPLSPAFALLLYCILSPHLTFTNDLMVVVVAWFLHAEKSLDGSLRIATLVALLVVLNCGPFKTFLSGDGGAHVAFVAKVGLLTLFLAALSAPARKPIRAAA